MRFSLKFTLDVLFIYVSHFILITMSRFLGPCLKYDKKSYIARVILLDSLVSSLFCVYLPTTVIQEPTCVSKKMFHHLLHTRTVNAAGVNLKKKALLINQCFCLVLKETFFYCMAIIQMISNYTNLF